MAEPTEEEMFVIAACVQRAFDDAKGKVIDIGLLSSMGIQATELIGRSFGNHRWRVVFVELREPRGTVRPMLTDTQAGRGGVLSRRTYLDEIVPQPSRIVGQAAARVEAGTMVALDAQGRVVPASPTSQTSMWVTRTRGMPAPDMVWGFDPAYPSSYALASVASERRRIEGMTDDEVEQVRRALYQIDGKLRTDDEIETLRDRMQHAVPSLTAAANYSPGVPFDVHVAHMREAWRTGAHLLYRIIRVIHAAQVIAIRRALAVETLFEIIRVVSRAWASNPRLLELDLEGPPPLRELTEQTTDFEARVALLELL